jgi:hypothetical protein
MNQVDINPASSPAPTAPASAPAIAEKVLGEIDWISPTEGYCECPGKDRHTSKNGQRDCMLYLDRVPTLHCVHASCKPATEAANRKLRAALLNASEDSDASPRRPTAADKARLAERERQTRIRLRAAKALPQLLDQYAWPYDAIIKESPVTVAGTEPDHWRLLLARFKPDDVVWIGDKFDSGKSHHARHFKTVTEWLKQTDAPGPFLCPSTFKNTSIARSNDNILARRFLVVESDALTKDQVGSVFKWLRQEAGLHLVAIVDTAGKSLHGWFAYPADEEVDDLKLVLPVFQCDPKLFTPSQPVRLPGALRDGKYQRLVYLEVPNE